MEERSLFILAAGLGNRLRPITDTIPKVMVEIEAGMPLLEHEIRGFAAQGFRHFVINLHYLPDVIRNYFGDGGKLGLKIEYSDESDVLLDTAGAVRKAAPMLSNSFVLLYGDHLHVLDLRKLIAKHEALSPTITLLLKRSDLPQNGDLVRIDKEGNIMEWIARPHNFHEFEHDMYLNTGAYVIEKEKLLPHITKPIMSLDKEVIPTMLKRGLPFAAEPTDEDILDIGTPEKLEIARVWYQNKREKIKKWYGEFKPQK